MLVSLAWGYYHAQAALSRLSGQAAQSTALRLEKKLPIWHRINIKPALMVLLILILFALGVLLALILF